VTAVSDNDAKTATGTTGARRHGRRARRLTPEETAEQQAIAARHTGELPRTSPQEAPEGADALPAGRPASRGAVAPPTADAPVPTLRRFGKRARIIEVEDAPEDETTGGHGDEAPAESAADGEARSTDSQPDQDRAADEGTAASEDAGAVADVESSGDESSSTDGEEPGTDGESSSTDDGAGERSADATGTAAGSRTQGRSAGGSAPAAATGHARAGTATIERDADGVELGELGVGDAPGPKPAPRFDGRVLNRPEQGSGRPLLWIVWVLIAAAIIALVILLATGVLGPDSAQADAIHDQLSAIAGSSSPQSVLPTHPDLEVTSA
jgi:hypothetical protein